jgi:thymidylate synthase
MKSIPVLHVSGRSLAEAYERALVALYRGGTRFQTQYDRPGDPPSLDCTMNLTVEDPASDPMIHKAFPGGFADLREYVYELQGLKDTWTKNVNDPEDTRWEYTYHGRLAAYGRWKEKVRTEGGTSSRDVGAFCVNQIERVIEKLARQPFTRQAQMITWMPNLDLDCFDPPCASDASTGRQTPTTSTGRTSNRRGRGCSIALTRRRSRTVSTTSTIPRYRRFTTRKRRPSCGRSGR